VRSGISGISGILEVDLDCRDTSVHLLRHEDDSGGSLSSSKKSS